MKLPKAYEKMLNAEIELQTNKTGKTLALHEVPKFMDCARQEIIKGIQLKLAVKTAVDKYWRFAYEPTRPR